MANYVDGKWTSPFGCPDVHLLSAKSRIQPLRSYQLSCKQESIQHLLARGMAAAVP
jgi:hypothetical protein